MKAVGVSQLFPGERRAPHTQSVWLLCDQLPVNRTSQFSRCRPSLIGRTRPDILEPLPPTTLSSSTKTTTPRTGWLREIGREWPKKGYCHLRYPDRQIRKSRETPPSVARGRTTYCTARAAKPATHGFIRYRLSSIRSSGFASGSSDDFSPSAQTLLTKAPSLAPSRVPPRSIGRQRFPRYFNTSNPRFEIGRLRLPASHTLQAHALSAYDVP